MTNDDEQIEAVAEALAETAGDDWKGMMPPSKAYYRRAAQGHALALAILRPLPAPECGERHVGCDDCGPCVLPPGHEGDHEGGDRTYDHDATRAEFERLRREVERLTCAAERADDVALQSQESRLTSLDDVSRLVAERDAARAELVAAQDVASRRYGDIQDLRYELKDARAELARLRAPVCCRALCKYAGREDEPCWGEVGVDEDVSKNGGEIPHLCSGHWYGMYTPEPPAAPRPGRASRGGAMSCLHEWHATPLAERCSRCQRLRPVAGEPRPWSHERRPWTPERRERVGRAAWAAHGQWMMFAEAAVPRDWTEMTEAYRESYRLMGEGAVRADEEGR